MQRHALRLIEDSQDRQGLPFSRRGSPADRLALRQADQGRADRCQDRDQPRVAVVLARDAVVDVLTGVLALAAFVLLVRYRVNSAVLVAAGGLISLVVEYAL